MTGRGIVSILACLAAGSVALTVQARQDQPLQVFRSATNAVSVDVTVQDRSRRPITRLTAADFEVFDNQVKQEIAEVGYARLPIDVTVALDVSYSVNGLMLERLRRGVVQLMSDFTAEDRLRLLLFNSKVARTLDFTSNASAVEAAIRRATAGGGTALLDSVSVSLVTPSAPDRRQLLVVFTDGLDSTSTTTPPMLASVALRSRAAVVFVLPANPSFGTTIGGTGTSLSPYGVTNPNTFLSSTNTLPARNASDAASAAARAGKAPTRPLDTLFLNVAASTGGDIVTTIATSDLTQVFRRILAEFRSAYVLRYNVRGSDLAGYHTLEVKVKRDGAIVNARRGYWY
jgi:VWFA-related protein